MQQLLKMNAYVDVVIPRGGEGLIQTVVQNSTVPVIETGTGICHAYVDQTADFAKAVPISDKFQTDNRVFVKPETLL